MSFELWQALFAATGFWPWLLLVPAYLFAQVRGEPGARALAHVILIAALLATALTTGSAPRRGDIFGLDCIVLGAVMVTVLRTRQLYPLPIASLQVLAVLLAGYSAAGLITDGRLVQVSAAVLGAGQLAIYAAGLIRHRSRRVRKSAGRRMATAFAPRPENAPTDLAPSANGAR